MECICFYCWCIWPNVVFVDFVKCLIIRLMVNPGHDEKLSCWIAFSQVDDTGLKHSVCKYFTNYGLLWSINAFIVLKYLLSISNLILVYFNFCVCITGDFLCVPWWLLSEVLEFVNHSVLTICGSRIPRGYVWEVCIQFPYTGVSVAWSSH